MNKMTSIAILMVAVMGCSTNTFANGSRTERGKIDNRTEVRRDGRSEDLAPAVTHPRPENKVVDKNNPKEGPKGGLNKAPKPDPKHGPKPNKGHKMGDMAHNAHHPTHHPAHHPNVILSQVENQESEIFSCYLHISPYQTKKSYSA